MTAAAPQQTEPYFSLHRGFVNRQRMRRLRAAGVDYAVAGTWRAVMFDLAANASTFGEFSTDVRAFVEACGGTPTPDEDAEHARTWRLFEHVGLVELDGDPAARDEVLGLPAEFRVYVPDVGDVNVQRKAPLSGAERTARWRERKAARAAARDESVTPERHASVTVTTCDDAVTCDAEPPTQPTTHTNQPPNAVTPTASPSVTPGGGGSADALTEAKQRLGDLLGEVDRIVARANGTRRIPFSDPELLLHFYGPAVELVTTHGAAAVAAALAEANGRDAHRIGYVATVIANRAASGADPITGKPDSDAARNAAITADLKRRHPQMFGATA